MTKNPLLNFLLSLRLFNELPKKAFDSSIQSSSYHLNESYQHFSQSPKLPLVYLKKKKKKVQYEDDNTRNIVTTAHLVHMSETISSLLHATLAERNSLPLLHVLLPFTHARSAQVLASLSLPAPRHRSHGYQQPCGQVASLTMYRFWPALTTAPHNHTLTKHCYSFMPT